MKIYEILGFTKTQWSRGCWLSALPDYSGTELYAKRKGDKKARLWIVMHSDTRHLAIAQSLDYSQDEWDKVRQDERIKILQPMVDEFYKNYNDWELIYDYK